MTLFNVAPANQEAHADLCQRLQQIRDRGVSDDNIMLEAADILTDAQAPLLDIIDQMSQELEVLRSDS